jgi:hypothetical protein
VTIERVGITNITPDASPGLIGFEQATSRTLFLKDMGCCSWRTNDQKYVFRNTPGAGKLFVENVSATGWRFEHPKRYGRVSLTLKVVMRRYSIMAGSFGC